jgi:hypothetical protein
VFLADCFALAFAGFDALTGAVDCNADVHAEYADFWVVFDAWDFDVFFEAEAEVAADVKGAFG